VYFTSVAPARESGEYAGHVHLIGGRTGGGNHAGCDFFLTRCSCVDLDGRLSILPGVRLKEYAADADQHLCLEMSWNSVEGGDPEASAAIRAGETLVENALTVCHEKGNGVRLVWIQRPKEGSRTNKTSIYDRLTIFDISPLARYSPGNARVERNRIILWSLGADVGRSNQRTENQQSMCVAAEALHHFVSAGSQSVQSNARSRHPLSK
jgi:hypothetical protein